MASDSSIPNNLLIAYANIKRIIRIMKTKIRHPDRYPFLRAFGSTDGNNFQEFANDV